MVVTLRMQRAVHDQVSVVIDQRERLLVGLAPHHRRA